MILLKKKELSSKSTDWCGSIPMAQVFTVLQNNPNVIFKDDFVYCQLPS